MIEYFENPQVQVVWEDKSENITNEGLKRVTEYFKKKYKTNNVKVIQKIIKNNDEIEINKDFNILDKNFQWKIAEDYIDSNDFSSEKEELSKLNEIVEGRLIIDYPDFTPFKKWRIKRIEFSNFLSYGENQVIDYDSLNGITVIESDPPNFGGKTTLGVDLLLFLFFNKILKGTTAEEVFNLYTDKNEVKVKGIIVIDDEEYMIERKVERKLNKQGDWKTKTSLDFFKTNLDGSLQDLNGEQRRETESFIKASIGAESDFLMTILTTGTNLNEFLTLKPTARGEVLNNFLGLEVIKKKEEICKSLYSEYSKSMVSNIYNIKSLEDENDASRSEITRVNNIINDNNQKIIALSERIIKGEKYREELLNKRSNDIDEDLASLNLENEKRKLSDLDEEKKKLTKEKEAIKLIKPKKEYNESEHDEIINQIKSTEKEITILEIALSEIKKLTARYENGIECENCGIKLIEAKYNKEKIGKKKDLEENLELIRKKENKLNAKEKDFTEIKEAFLNYEKQKLVSDKISLKLESNALKSSSVDLTIKRFKEQEKKIEENKKIDLLLSNAKKTLNEINFEKENIIRETENNKDNIKRQDEKIIKNKKLISKIQEEQKVEKIYKIFLQMYGKHGISKIIMKSMIPFINEELRILMEDAALFTLLIKVNERNEVEFWMRDNATNVEKLLISGSGYEKTIASLALRSVMTKISTLPKPNIIVFDEIFGGVANENMDLIGDFFNKLKLSFENIFIITHNKIVNNWADNVILVQKENNISFITKK